MSKEPEVGDVFIYHNKQIMSVIKISHISEDVCCLCYENLRYNIYDFQKEHFIKYSRYLGKSKANIDDLFKMENEE